MKIVTLDLETSPYEAYTWGLWEQNVANNQIIKDRTVMAVCVKELGKKPEYWDTSKSKDPRSDFTLIDNVWHALDKADIVVTQNGKSFDIPILNARFVTLGFPPPSPYAQVDTCATAKRVFKFASNKLEWLASELTGFEKSIHKKYPGFTLWTACLAGDPKAWAEMRKYNIRDVRATEALYLKLRPWVPNHPYVGKSSGACGNCGSKHLQRRGERRTVSFMIERLQCQDCGSWQSGARRKVK